MTPLLWSFALLHQLKHQAIHLTPPPPRPPLCTTISPALGFPLRLSHAITRGDRAHPEDRRSMVRIVVEAMQVLCRNLKRASCEEVAMIIVNRYPQIFADFTEKGERLGCGHYSLLRSIKSRVEHRTRNEEDCSPNSNATSPKKVRCLVDSYGCINWQPVELPEGETPASLEEKKDILLTIFNSQGRGAVERPDVDDFMCLTYISQHQLINSCPSLSMAEIQELWPFLFTRKGLSNHFHKLTGIDISERLSQALITKSRRIVNYFSSQKLKWNLGIRTLLQQIESEEVLTNNKVGTAAILLMMKYYKENEDSLFVLADVSFFHTALGLMLLLAVLFFLLHKMSWSFFWQETSTRMSLEAESNLPITSRLIMLDDPWPMLSGHLHEVNNNEDKLSHHLTRSCLCPIGFLSATVLIFFSFFYPFVKNYFSYLHFNCHMYWLTLTINELSPQSKVRVQCRSVNFLHTTHAHPCPCGPCFVH
ncbi:NLR family CARD domain-containing protein 3 [Sarotherodon galilaeus]